MRSPTHTVVATALCRRAGSNASTPRRSEAATKPGTDTGRDLNRPGGSGLPRRSATKAGEPPYLVVFNYGLKLAVSVMGPPIVIEAGLFVPE
jgi:hypothetical protein